MIIEQYFKTGIGIGSNKTVNLLICTKDTNYNVLFTQMGISSSYSSTYIALYMVVRKELSYFTCHFASGSIIGDGVTVTVFGY